MAYISNADIQERLGNSAYVQLTDDDGDGQADVGVVDEARLGAEGEVNSFLARRYTVPIDVTIHADLAGLLATVTLDLVEMRLRSRRPPVPEETIRRHALALTWLGDVAEGRIELPSASLPANNAAKGTIAAARGAARVLTDEELNRF
jgi:phage gp36-like protein